MSDDKPEQQPPDVQDEGRTLSKKQPEHDRPVMEDLGTPGETEAPPEEHGG